MIFLKKNRPTDLWDEMFPFLRPNKEKETNTRKKEEDEFRYPKYIRKTAKKIENMEWKTSQL